MAIRQGQPGEPRLLFIDDFDEACLDLSNWFPYYLPHWSSRARTQASYRIQDGYLRLFIGQDQQPWFPEFDGDVRVSNLQTGHWSGPIGSARGQHRFRSGLTVRDVLPERRLFLPHYCRLEMRARTKLNPWNLAALWLIGFEDEPERSGEITVFEVFGHNVDAEGVKIGRGVKRLNDPTLTTALDEGKLPIDPGDWHVYAMDWNSDGISFFVDGAVVSTTAQSPDYPMQLMLNLYDLPGDHDRSAATDAWFDVDYVRAWEA